MMPAVLPPFWLALLLWLLPPASLPDLPESPKPLLMRRDVPKKGGKP